MSIAHSMRSAAREIFLHALSEASIEKAFDRHVSYQRGVLRVCDDLYDLKSFSRVVSIS
ncbi:MAG: glycerate 2-kinase, partial [Candidatus Angelobacter sp.]|nr:glycerate 2-kinase [Candidatus Angelobacter sp.]